MEKVISVNLGGNAYQLEESAHTKLLSYIESAEVKLAGDPDKAEIIKDLEQAIGQKCSAHMGSHKNVVTLSDMEAVLAEMGPVSAAGDASQSEAPKESAAPHKRLYQIREGAIISGVCKGLSAYFNLDISLVRILFVVFTFITQGWGILLYIVMMIFVPVARTQKEMSQASGEMPVTAQELVDRAKEGYEHFKHHGEWRKWKEQARHESRFWKQEAKSYAQDRHSRHRERYWQRQERQRSPFWEFMQMVGGVLWLFFIGFLTWLAYHHVAPVHQFLDSMGAAWSNLMYQIANSR